MISRLLSEYKYDRQGELTELKDQNGTVHDYTYDNLGRQVSDAATTLGTNIDGAVRRIEDSYNVRGQVESVTSYDAASGGNVVNQVDYTYNDAGLLSREYEEHDGAVDQNTLYVQYDYAGAAQGYRLTAVQYPNGRLIHCTYGSAGSGGRQPEPAGRHLGRRRRRQSGSDARQLSVPRPGHDGRRGLRGAAA